MDEMTIPADRLNPKLHKTQFVIEWAWPKFYLKHEEWSVALGGPIVCKYSIKAFFIAMWNGWLGIS